MNAFEFKPYSLKQKKVLTWWLPEAPVSDRNIIICEGSIRSGKTVSMIDSFFNWSLSEFPNGANFPIIGRTIDAVNRNVIEEAKKILTAKGIPYSHVRSDMPRLEVGNNKYYIFGANDEKAREKIKGLTTAGELADEIALFPESFIAEMIGRASVEGARHWWNCNPEGPFHYIKTEWIDKAEEKNALVLHFTMDDNLTLSPSKRAEYARMFNGLWYKRLILGLWVAASGAIYDMFDDKVHVRPAPSDLTRFITATDYGTNNPFTVGLFGWGSQTEGPNKIWLVREYYYDSNKRQRQMTDGEYADAFINWLGNVNPDANYVDPSAASYIAELKKRGRSVKDAKNDVLDGIRFVSNCLSNNLFYVDPSCINTISEFPAYIWDPKAQQKGEDKPVKQHDHCLDRTRYALYSHFSKSNIGIIDKPKGW